ncbi:MAG: YmdB family metallophosphoesterase [Spirochaetaceae bacterium]|jgi:metallophosphoesterase (TIGR00282 family)|nr:YmdB family metallophosphoesterase [Spirochaetaceae bacterium]
MRILYVAEIVGRAGIFAFKKGIKELRQQKEPDFVIAGADGVTGANGLSRNHASYLHKLGAHVLTCGECSFFKKDLVENIEHIHYVLRPVNLNYEAPGYGSRIYRIGDKKIAVAVLIGQSGFIRMHGNNPFIEAPLLCERLRQETPYIVLDFHATTTAEKRILFSLADGLCSAVIGSHTRVQTADAAILSGGTAVITDAGRTGSQLSVGGVDVQERITNYITGIPDWTKEAVDKPALQGVLIEISESGKAVSIERIQHPVGPLPDPAPESAPDVDR